jgi:hypothetical protein
MGMRVLPVGHVPTRGVLGGLGDLSPKDVSNGLLYGYPCSGSGSLPGVYGFGGRVSWQ